MFVGREKEISLIGEVLKKRSGSVLIYGKRKVGKTTLLTHSLRSSAEKTVYYECLKSSMEDNVEGFVRVLERAKILPVYLPFRSFAEVFNYLNTIDETFNIVIDEYPYLKAYTKAETVDSLFQTIIDNHLKNIRLFISGSHVGMMKDMLEERNALYGRFDITIRLKELNYKEAAAFYPEKSIYEKIAFYSVFGGSPYVNGFIDNEKTLRENIIKTVLCDTHPIYNYAEHLLISDFTNALGAERVFFAISNGKKKYGEIEARLGIKANGLLSKQLASLLHMELISKNFPINKPDNAKKATYEINDNLLRFYYAFVYKNKSALKILGAEAFYKEYIEPSIITFISHRFEEICREYFSLMAKKGELGGVINIGTYSYDNSETKTNGEFDVVLARKEGYEIYEVKYFNSPMSLKNMETEAKKIEAIKELGVTKTGFISASGFEVIPDKYECIDGTALYQ